MVKKEGKGIWPLRNILDLQPDVVVLAGDLIYNDETINKEEICGTCGYFLNQFDAIECNNVEGCELRHSYSEYENLLQDTYFKKLVADTKVALMWDDHEFWNDYDLGPKNVLYLEGKKHFVTAFSNVLSPPLETGEIYYTMEFGKFGEAFVLDPRSYRSSQFMEDGEQKTMLGLLQRKHLFSWLTSCRKRWKFVVISATLSETANNMRWSGEEYTDTWYKYRWEKNLIFDFISSHGIRNVVFLTSDSHTLGLYTYNVGNVEMWEVAASPLFAGKGGGYPTLVEDVLFLKTEIRSGFAVVDVEENELQLKMYEEIEGYQHAIVFEKSIYSFHMQNKQEL